MAQVASAVIIAIGMIGPPAARAAARHGSSAQRPSAARNAAAKRRSTLATGDKQGWNGFGPGSWPGGSWRPYSNSSPFNQPIGTSKVVAGSAAMVSAVLSRFGRPAPLVAGASGTAGDFGHPVYYAQPTDPQLTLRPTENWGNNPIAGVRIPVPTRAKPAGGADGHMTIVTPDGWEYDLWQAHRAGSHLDFSWGGRTRIDGSGLGSGATAALFGGLAGVIRPEELAAGHIDHALFIVLKCTSNNESFGHGVSTSPASTGDGSYVYPAEHGGSVCGAGDPDLPPLGTRFMLDMTGAQIRALDVPNWKKTILTALARYGGYVGDTGGAGFGFEFQSSATYTSFGTLDPLVAFARRNHIPSWHGEYAFNMADGVNWRRYLRIVAPPSADGGQASARRAKTSRAGR